MKVVKYLAFTALLILLIGIIACNPATQTGQPSGNDRETAQSPNPASGQPTVDNSETGEGQGNQSPVEGTGTGAAETTQQIDGVASPSGTAETGTGGDQIVTVILPDGTTVVWNYTDDIERMAGLNIPEGWPNDVPIMTGFEHNEELPNVGGPSSPCVMASGNATSEEVKAYYSHLPSWEFKEDMQVANAPEDFIAFVLKQDTKSLLIMFGPVELSDDQSEGFYILSLSVPGE
jgi:hypothetical protein